MGKDNVYYLAQNENNYNEYVKDTRKRGKRIYLLFFCLIVFFFPLHIIT